MSWCRFCDGGIPSLRHKDICLAKSQEELIAIAQGYWNRQDFLQEERNKLIDQITFWQGKFAILKQENNRLRNKLRGLGDK